MNLSVDNKIENFADINGVITEKINQLSNSQHAIDKDFIKRIVIEIPQINILNWLQSQNISEKFYWSNQDNSFESAGIGVAIKISNGDDKRHSTLFSKIKQILSNSDVGLKFYGGFKFDPSLSLENGWMKFGKATFIVPQIELIRKEEKYYFACHTSNVNAGAHNKLPGILISINFKTSPTDNNGLLKLSRIDYPDKARWEKMIHSARRSFTKKEFKKIVLARSAKLEYSDKLKADKVMSNLKKKSFNCFHFLFQPEDGHAFVGASPERLYRRIDKTVRCEAIAGTIKRGENEIEDNFLARDLLGSDKDINEHRFVTDSIIEGMSTLSDDKITADDVDINVLKLARVQHLWGRMKFNLKSKVTDEDLLYALHPTAAVGGYPKEKIYPEIYKLEQFDRGWYAAPIGWIGKDSAEFVVAIRSGLIVKNDIYLYSGAGIVPASDSDKEWEEIENKISNFLKALN